MRNRLLPLALLLLASCDRDSAPAEQPPRPGGDPPPVEIPVPAEPIVAINVQPPEPEHVDRVLDALLELRIQHIRSSWWPWSDSSSWSWLPAYRRAGIEVLPLVYPRDVPAEESGVSMAARYRDLYDAFGSFPYVQLGNEVDGWSSKGGGPFALAPGKDPCLQGRRWAEQTRIAVELIREFDPDVQVVSAGVAWNRDGVLEFVRCFVVDAPIDVIAIHPYGVHIYGEPLSRWESVAAQGWTGPIWATEWGVSRAEAEYAGADADQWQLENWRQVLNNDPSRFGYQRLYGFQLTPAEAGWGILNADWTPRPAYRWLRDR